MKLIVEIDLGEVLSLSAEEYKNVARPVSEDGRPRDGFITVDDAFLTRDTDDSFYVFKLVNIVED